MCFLLKNLPDSTSSDLYLDDKHLGGISARPDASDLISWDKWVVNKRHHALHLPYGSYLPSSPMRWMRHRGDRVKIISGKYAGQIGTVDSNVYQRTVDYPDELNNGHHVMLDTEELVTVRWGQVETAAELT